MGQAQETADSAEAAPEVVLEDRAGRLAEREVDSVVVCLAMEVLEAD